MGGLRLKIANIPPLRRQYKEQRNLPKTKAEILRDKQSQKFSLVDAWQRGNERKGELLSNVPMPREQTDSTHKEAPNCLPFRQNRLEHEEKRNGTGAPPTCTGQNFGRLQVASCRSASGLRIAKKPQRLRISQPPLRSDAKQKTQGAAMTPQAVPSA